MQTLFEIIGWIFFTSVSMLPMKIVTGLVLLISAYKTIRGIYSGMPPFWGWIPARWGVLPIYLQAVLDWIGWYSIMFLFFTWVMLQVRMFSLLFS